MIHAVLSNFDSVARFTVKNLNKDFINAVRGGGSPRFMKVFHQIPVFFEGWLPLVFSLWPVKSESMINNSPFPFPAPDFILTSVLTSRE